MNNYTLLARERKIGKLIDAMDRWGFARMTASVAARLDLAQLTEIITLADVRPPSPATMDALAERLVERDRNWDGCECRYRGDVEDASGCPLHAGGDENRDTPGAQD